MAKSRRRRSSKKAASRGKTIAKHGYNGRKFDCYGKMVRAGKKRTKVPRIFCGRDAK